MSQCSNCQCFNSDMCTLSKSDMETILAKKLESTKFEINSWEKTNTPDASIGYLSSTEKITIYYKVNGVIENCSLFVKRAPLEASHREEVLSMGCFQREAKVFNLFLNHIKDKVNDCFPLCYLARSDLLVLEDTSVKGYRNYKVLESFDLKHCMKTLDSLVKIHAASIIWESNKKIKLTKLIPDLKKELIFTKEDGHVGRKRHLVGVKALKAFTREYLSHYPEDVVCKAFDFLTAIPEKLDPSTKYLNVLSHNDLWSNNIMFRYDSDGQVENAFILDFQCSTYRPPTFDLLILIHCCLSKEVRRKNSSQLVKYYYDNLQRCLRKADIDNLITWNTFTDMYEDSLPVVLALTPQYMHFAGMPDHIIKPILQDDKKWKEYYQHDRDQIVLQAASESFSYRNKLIEGLEDLFEYFSQFY